MAHERELVEPREERSRHRAPPPATRRWRCDKRLLLHCREQCNLSFRRELEERCSMRRTRTFVHVGEPRKEVLALLRPEDVCEQSIDERVHARGSGSRRVGRRNDELRERAEELTLLWREHFKRHTRGGRTGASADGARPRKRNRGAPEQARPL